MPEHQDEFSFELPPGPAPEVPADLRDEVAQVWGLPLGQPVEVCFRGSDRAVITGVLDLLSAPTYPWNPRQPLQLRIAGYVFSSRDVDRWIRLT